MDSPSQCRLLAAAGGGALAALALTRLLQRGRCGSSSAKSARCAALPGRTGDGSGATAAPAGEVPFFEWGTEFGQEAASRINEVASSSPAAFRGVPLGSCRSRWTDAHLEAAAGDIKVQYHSAETPSLNFVSKNFKYEVGPMREFLQAARRNNASDPYMYYRSQHPKRNKPSNLDTLGSLADDFCLPADLSRGFETHSTVLRVASTGLRMWLHYDICDNFLCCVRGRKRVMLFPPTDVGHLYIGSSSSSLGSRLLDGDVTSLQDVFSEYPLAAMAWPNRLEVVLEEGDVLFIPAMWFHCTEALGHGGEGPADRGASGLCISANVFLLRPRFAALHDSKDVWANRELLPAQEALKVFEGKCLPALRRLPPAHRSFYSRKFAACLLGDADIAEQQDHSSWTADSPAAEGPPPPAPQ